MIDWPGLFQLANKVSSQWVIVSISMMGVFVYTIVDKAHKLV